MFWTPKKISIVIFLFSLLVLTLIVLFVYLGLIEFYSGGGTIK
jgi:hypothetical protein